MAFSKSCYQFINQLAELSFFASTPSTHSALKPPLQPRGMPNNMMGSPPPWPLPRSWKLVRGWMRRRFTSSTTIHVAAVYCANAERRLVHPRELDILRQLVQILHALRLLISSGASRVMSEEAEAEAVSP